MKKITSFTIDHNKLLAGIYISRVDGDITTYDMRTRRPNIEDVMDNVTMHSFEHMFATLIRNSKLEDNIIYFGPMGCQTGFYLLIRNADHEVVLETMKETLRNIITYEGPVFGDDPAECGNHKTLDLDSAQKLSKEYLEIVKDWTVDELAYRN